MQLLRLLYMFCVPAAQGKFKIWKILNARTNAPSYEGYDTDLTLHGGVRTATE
ncbi:hypothetical protein [uncultured Campylobacter sp.]|uniref:hypothetical protein n=1 Tax=uncultured Campylobacter sp. TaxID=218934 RepID=UPI002637B783|nr:hypothetical protein [uncultured Campylobacter sp.]